MNRTWLQVLLKSDAVSPEPPAGGVAADGPAGVEFAGDLEALITLEKSQVRHALVAGVLGVRGVGGTLLDARGAGDTVLDAAEPGAVSSCPTALAVLRFDCGHLGDDDAHDRRAAADDVVRLLRVAASIGATRVNIPVATVRSGTLRAVRYQDALNRIHAILPRLAREAEHCGVTLCVAAARDGFLMSPPELRELLDAACSHNIGADIALHGRCDGADWRDWVETLASLTRSVHLPVSADVRRVGEVADFCASCGAVDADLVMAVHDPRDI